MPQKLHKWSLKMSLFSFEITVATLWKKMADVSFTFILVRFNSSNYQCTKIMSLTK